MRHRKAFASVVICLLASLGLSSQALALTGSDCDGTPYTNEFALHEFFVDSPLSHKAGAVGGISRGFLACGSDLTDTGSHWTVIDHVTIPNPPGVEITNTSTVPFGSYVGEAEVDLLTHRDGLPAELRDVDLPMYVDYLSVCESESQKLVGGQAPAQIIACYEGKNDVVGYNWNWVELDSVGGSWFTVGPIYYLGGYPNRKYPTTLAPALTRMHMDICGYFGAVGGSSCGTSGANVQRNGNASASFPKLKCDANGSFEATAIRRDGRLTQRVYSCVSWVDESDWGVYPRLRSGPSHDLPSPGQGLPKQPRPRWPLHDPTSLGPTAVPRVSS